MHTEQQKHHHIESMYKLTTNNIQQQNPNPNLNLNHHSNNLNSNDNNISILNNKSSHKLIQPTSISSSDQNSFSNSKDNFIQNYNINKFVTRQIQIKSSITSLQRLLSQQIIKRQQIQQRVAILQNNSQHTWINSRFINLIYVIILVVGLIYINHHHIVDQQRMFSKSLQQKLQTMKPQNHNQTSSYNHKDISHIYNTFQSSLLLSSIHNQTIRKIVYNVVQQLLDLTNMTQKLYVIQHQLQQYKQIHDQHQNKINKLCQSTQTSIMALRQSYQSIIKTHINQVKHQLEIYLQQRQLHMQINNSLRIQNQQKINQYLEQLLDQNNIKNLSLSYMPNYKRPIFNGQNTIQTFKRLYLIDLTLNGYTLYLTNLKEFSMQKFVKNKSWNHIQLINFGSSKLNDNDWRVFVDHAYLFANLKNLLLYGNQITMILEGDLQRFRSLERVDFQSRGIVTPLSEQSISVIKRFKQKNSQFMVTLTSQCWNEIMRNK